MDKSLFKTVARADLLLSELYKNSSQAEEFLELFTLQFIVGQLNQAQLLEFEQLLQERDDLKINTWLREEIEEFDKKYLEKLQKHLLNIYPQ